MFISLRMHNKPKKWAMRLLVFFLISAIALSVDTRLASAHAFLLRTEPADGLVLLTAPKQMRLWFSEPLGIDLTKITLLDANNKTWQLKPYADAGDSSVVVVDLPDLPPSAYRINWRTVSDEDLHVISGSVVFGIQQSVNREGTGQTQNAAPTAEVTFHWIGLLSFAALLGALINILFLFPGVKTKIKDEQKIIILTLMQRKTTSLALWCSVIAFIAGLFTLWSRSINAQGTGVIENFNWKLFTNLVSNIFIKRELASEACLIVSGLLIFSSLKQKEEITRVAAGNRNTVIRNLLLFLFAFIWILLQALNSHALSFNGFSPLRVIAYAFHILGASMWIGGQTALIFFIAPRLRARDEQYDLAREIYFRFGGIAALGVAILIITGLYSAGQQVASLDALLFTPYGQALLLKTLLVLLTGLFGLRHASHFHPRVARLLHKFISQRAGIIIFGKVDPAATLRLQLLGGVAVFLLAVYMGSTQPARGPEFEAPAQTASAASPQASSLSSMANDLLVNFSIKPNQPGKNFINVGVFDTRRPSPAPIDQVVVKLLPPNAQDEIQTDMPASKSDGAGNYQVSTDAIGISGDWEVSVVIHRKGMQDAVLGVPWTVATSAPIVSSRPVFISNRPLAPLFTMASLLLSILFGGAWLVVTLKPNLFYWPDNKTTSQEVNS